MCKSFHKLILTLLLLTLGADCSFGFSMFGPYDTWQVAALGYQQPEDYGGPQNLGDRFRWNTKVVFYACDSSFTSFFGATGVSEVDKAFTYFNTLSDQHGHTNLSTMITTDFPLNTTRANQTAANLSLIDVRSVTMSRIANILGLAQPDRWVWTLHDAFAIPGSSLPCPLNMEYVTVQRNFDPISYTYSSYVDGQLYNYYISDNCSGSAVAVPVGVDNSIKIERAVADGLDANFDSVAFGRYYSGLTRDDVGGLQYLMSAKQFQLEGTPNGATQIATNSSSPVLTNTLDYALFQATALNTDPATLQTLYPGLQITSTNISYVLTVTTNYTASTFYSNAPYAPVDQLPTLYETFNPVYSTNLVTNYSYTYGNVQVLNLWSNSTFTDFYVEVKSDPYSPALNPHYVTNTVSNSYTGTFTNGEFIILPSNACGGLQVVSNLLTNVTSIPLFSYTNSFATNVTNFNIIGNLILSYTNTYQSTNHTLLVYTSTCSTNAVALRGGVDKVTFIRHDYDSLLGTYWSPVTSSYQMVELTNNILVTNTYFRTVTQPDILIRGKDQIAGPAVVTFNLVQFGGYNYDKTHLSTDGQGPGLIYPQVTMDYGKSGGPIYINTGFGNLANALQFYQWGTFDGSTNAPTAYPSGTSLQTLVSNLYFQVTNTAFPYFSIAANYTTAKPYLASLGVSGGTAPYKWSVAPNSPYGTNLPSFLSLTNIASTWYLEGLNPTNVAPGTTFDFYLQATDATGRTAFGACSFVVNP